jgi:hypothetical protein
MPYRATHAFDAYYMDAHRTNGHPLYDRFTSPLAFTEPEPARAESGLVAKWAFFRPQLDDGRAWEGTPRQLGRVARR